MHITIFSEARSPYLVINVLTGVAIIVFLLYPVLAGHPGGVAPVECVHVTTHGGECSTCGLTRSFAEMARGNYTSAAMLNRNGPLIFGFFVIQLFMRAFFGYLYYRGSGPVTRPDAGKPAAGHGSIVGANARNVAGLGIPADTGKPDPGPENTGGGRLRAIIMTDAFLSLALFVFCFRYLIVFWQ
ncbi:MAG: DUF2752 domain-containing protein [Marinilabiliales bacterium]|nr:MAG: DUF2752 domain-containing protein [Marinilabiliales bacterium]